jgi:hypothetical protein
MWLSDTMGDWIEKTLPPRWADDVIDWTEEYVARPGQWLLCRLFGHIPTTECPYPDHDYCLWCRKSMPGMASRGADPGDSPAAETTEDTS